MEVKGNAKQSIGNLLCGRFSRNASFGKCHMQKKSISPRWWHQQEFHPVTINNM